MTVIRPNSVSGITSITAQANEINFFRSNGALAGLQLNGVNFNTTTGVSTFNNLDVGGVLTYQDVTNVDSIGIITARSTIDAQGDVSIADKIIHTGDTNTAIRFPSADTITAETAGSERLRIDSNGHFKATNGSTSDFNTIQRASTSNYAGIRIQDADATQRMQIGVAGGTNNICSGAAQHDVVLKSYANLLLATNQTERLRIDSDGNIGLGGITSPLWTSGGGMHLNDNYGIGFGNGGSGRPDFQLMVTDGSTLQFRCGFGADTADINMDTSGRLLIGTTSPSISSSELFEVKSTAGGFSHFRNNSSSYAPIYIDNEATNNGSTLAPLITITDGGGNRAGLLLNNSSVFNISGQGSVSLSTGGTVGNATERLVVEPNSGIGKVKIQGEQSGGTTYGLEIIGNQQTNAVSGADAGARIIAPVARRMYFELRANDDTDHFAWLGNPDYNTGVADTILMELHPKGYLQTPLQPSFMANFGSNNNTSHNNGDYLKFSNTDHNTGNCYNTSNYRFTAPVAGNYLFYGRANMSGVTTNDYSRSYQVRLYKNGSSEQYHMARTTLTGYSGSYPDSSTMVCSINLAASDYVQLKVNWETDGTLSGTENLHHHGSMFGGYLIG